ncbi:hypothetical protein [Oceanidesulfovibrio marinus]|uniref:Uncharacterized protein n=1 Tax=Oceanidesulfovibrio marinus TaxID=370038 RepID=A0ABX6NGN4_9BACT|nr:hypothetical protein [Oceanidesulfovibrio marinus]QJT09386.1 hypothetical protein E8L03_10730 [Oceanidesulfovibrio marinus]
MKRLTVFLIAAAFVVSMAGAAAAGGDLVGEWKSTGEIGGAVSGEGSHGLGSGDARFAKQGVAWTLKVTKQDSGGGFYGQWCSANNCEDVVGVVRRDDSLLMSDEDSYFIGSMYAGRMELCVMEAGKKFRAAVCQMMEKQ